MNLWWLFYFFHIYLGTDLLNFSETFFFFLYTRASSVCVHVVYVFMVFVYVYAHLSLDRVMSEALFSFLLRGRACFEACFWEGRFVWGTRAYGCCKAHANADARTHEESPAASPRTFSGVSTKTLRPRRGTWVCEAQPYGPPVFE